MFRTNLRHAARGIFAPLFLGFCVVLLDCATLDKLPETSCGNGVVDVATEDCDTFPNDPKDTTHARCGAPSEGEFACHLRCGSQPNGDTLACPDGWGCSVAGICREPSGDFKPPLGAVSGGANQLAVGDFDGDGRSDLIGFGLRNAGTNASRLRVHFFDDSGGLTHVAVLPGQSVSPAVFDHDHDGRADIAFGVAVPPQSPGALGVVSGQADKTFLPIMFQSASLPDTEAVPAFVYPAANVPLPTAEPYAILVVERKTPSVAALTSVQAELGGTERLAVPLLAGPEAVRGNISWGSLFPGNTSSTCGELVVAMQPDGASGSTLYVVSPCTLRVVGKASKWSSDPTTALKTFAIDVPLAPESRGALIADVDDDGHLDVLIDTTKGPYVAYGEATGKTLLAPRPWTPDGITPAMPLAAGDFDLDGKTDFIFSDSVAAKQPLGAFATVPDAGTTSAEGGADGGPDGGIDAGGTSNPDGKLFPLKLPLQSWNGAVLGNFNADPYPDLIVARLNSPDLVAVLGGPDGTTPTTITTDGRVEAIAKGDFDGDHIDDLAITESTSVTGTSDVWIAYGRAFGGLEAPARIGSVDTPKGIGAAANGSSPTDLGLFSYAKTLNAGQTYHTTSLTLLKGSGDRQPVAPLLFLESLSCTRSADPCLPMSRPQLPATTERFWDPIGVAAGHFASTDDSAVLAYATGASPKSIALGAWVANADPKVPGGLDAPVERQVLDGTLDILDSAGGARLATATGKVDSADKLEKIVAMTNAPGSPDALLLVVDPAANGASPGTTFLKGLRVEIGAQLSLVDLDGDGLLDAVGSFGAPPDAQVYAFLNQGKGVFAAPGIKVTFPSEDAATGDSPIAFAPINLRGAPATGGNAQTKGLAILTSHSVMLATLRSDKQGFDSRSLASVLAKDFGNATGIAAGDFNGDGLDDIAIADGSIRILLQKPKRDGK
jgi:hypothetical protein